MTWHSVILLPLAAVLLMGQTTGALEGTVRDPSGAVVPAAMLKIVETATATQRSAETSATGRYLAPRLTPGTYEVTVSRAGFRDQVQSGIPVDAGSTARVDFHLVLGEARDHVLVSAEAILLDASPSGSASTVRQQQLENLPLMGRDVFELAAQQPGVLLQRNSDPTVTRGGSSPKSVMVSEALWLQGDVD